MKPNRSNILFCFIALSVSQLAWAGPKFNHGDFKISKEEILEGLKLLHNPGGERAEAPNKARAKMTELFGWSAKVADKDQYRQLFVDADPELTKLDPEALFLAFVKTSSEVIKEIDEYLLERANLVKLNKKPFDLEADLALVDEALYLRRMRRIVAEAIKPDPAAMKKDPKMKFLFTELLIRMNQDRVLLGYGKEMLKISSDVAQTDKPVDMKRLMALRDLQQTEVNDPKIMKSFVTEVTGGKVYNANYRTDLNRAVYEAFFDVKKDELNKDSLFLGYELLMRRHVPTVIDTFDKLPKEEPKKK